MTELDAPALIVFSGLPGVGKTTISRHLTRALSATYLRIDAIETGLAESVLSIACAKDAGYTAAYRLASENLALGRPVIGDSVNPCPLTREGWAAVAEAARARLLNVEIVCSDTEAHRGRVETRRAATGRGPDWAAVCARDYAPWGAPFPLRLDTASLSAEACSARIVAALNGAAPTAAHIAPPDDPPDDPPITPR